MKKRVLSLLTVLIFCISLLPAAALADDGDVCEMGGTTYATLQEALDEANDNAEITLLGNVTEDGIIVYAATTIDMAGFSITGDVEADAALTLKNGTIVGQVTVDISEGTFILTAPSDAEAAIDGGLTVNAGGCLISGAKVGVKETLYVDGDDFTVSGTEKAVLLNEAAKPASKALYGSANENGDTSAEAVFDTDTYKVGGAVAKKLSNTQVGEPPEETITLTPEAQTIVAGETAVFTAAYNGTDTLNAYIQKSGIYEEIDAAADKTETQGEWKITVPTTEATAAGDYKLFVHATNNTFVSQEATITVKEAVAKDSVGNYYSDIKTAITSAADGSTVTVIANNPQLPLPEGIYADTGSDGITLDLNGHSLDGRALNVGGYNRTGKLTVIDSSNGNGAVGLEVRSGGTLIFNPGNEHTALLQLVAYGGTTELYGGRILASGLRLENDCTLAGLLPSGKGLAFCNESGSRWIELADAQNKNFQLPSYNLIVTQCEHTGVDADSNCLYCGQAMVAETGGRYYATVKAAIAAANANDTVTLLKSVDEQCTIEKNMTIDLGGNKINSNITIKSGSTLALAGKGTVTVVQSGTELDGVVGGALNVLSDDVIVSTLSVQQIPKPEMNLNKGTYWKIKLSDNLKDIMTASGLLAKGYAFVSNGSGNVVDGYVYRLDDVKIAGHTHDTTTGKCVCGYTCDHSSGYENGKCTNCGAECPHTNINETTYICNTCNMQIVVKTETKSGAVKYGTDLTAAINEAEDGTTVTILRETSLSSNMYIIGVGKKVTLNLNGHSVDRSNRYVLGIGGTGVSEMEKGGTLAIAGAGNFLSNIIVLTSGALDLSGWTGENLNNLYIYEQSSVIDIPSGAHIREMWLSSFTGSSISEVALKGGSYGYIYWQNFNNIDLSLGNLLAPGYAFRRENGDLVPYSEKLSYDSPDNLIKNVTVVKCTDHADSDGDGRCDYCNGKLVVSIAKNNGESRAYTNLQDAFDTIGDDLYTATLLDDASGSYTLAKGKSVRFIMNSKTVDELVVSGNVRIALNGQTGAVNSIIFRGNSGFNAGSEYIRIKNLTVADGATWSGILPDDSRYGYNVYSDDLKSHTWYDNNTVGNVVSLSNVYVAQLPINMEPILMIDGGVLTGENNVSVYKQLNFSFKASVVNGYRCTGALFIQKEGASEPTRIDAVGDDNNNFNCPSKTFELSEIGTYKVWAEASKEGYTLTSKKYTLNVEANLSEADVELEQKEFTYTPSDNGGEELEAKIKSVKLYDHEIPASEYIVSGNKGTDARDYTLTINPADGSPYTGSVSTGWKILPRVLTRIVACDYIKSYDGTTAVNADNIGKNDLLPHFHYDGGPVAGIVLGYKKDYNITSVTADYADANAESHCDVSFTVELTNPNYTFRDENDKDTRTKTVTQGMNIGRAKSLPQGCEPETGSIAARNGAAHTYTYDVSKLLKTLPEGLDYGTKKFRLKNVNIYDGDYIDDNAVSISEDGVLTVPVKKVNAPDEPEIAKVTINVIAQNYRDFTVTVMVKAKNKLVPTGEPTLSNDGTITYGDTIDKISLSGSMKGENDEAVEGTFAWKNPTDKPSKAGDYEAEWTFTPNGDNAYMYATTTGTATIKVNKAAFPVDKIKIRPEKIEELVYKYKSGGTADPQVLHTEGSVEDGWGTMVYTTVNPETAAADDWQTAPISAVDAGDYTIYYKVLGTENYLDSDYGTIKCHIEKYALYYNVICKKKTYDATTEAELESIKFFPYSSGDEEVKFSSEDYEVKNLKYNSPNAGAGFGEGAVEASGDVSLKDTPATRNYKLKEGGRIYGYIKTAVFPDVANFHDYEFEIRYNDITKKTFGAKAFGAQKDEGYVVNSDNVNRPGTDKELNKRVRRDLNDDGTCSFYLTEPLTEAYIGKKFVEKMRISSADDNYCSHPDGEQTLSVIITIVDKATPDLSVAPISVTYDGSPVSADKIVGTATYHGAEVKGTWSWDGGISPTNVADSGAYKVVFTPVGADAYHSASKPVLVTVNPCTTAPKVELSQYEYTYDGNEKKPAVTVTVDGRTLEEGTDYEIAYSNNRNAGTAAVTVTSKANYAFAEVEESFKINKATVKVKPKDVTKVYGDDPKFALESTNPLITEEELAKAAESAAFTSDGAKKTAPVKENGYAITVQLSDTWEPDNLTLEAEGTGVLTVTKAELTITVKDASREYGAENPALEAEFSGFKNGENESVLTGELKFRYDDGIDAKTPVGRHNVTNAYGLESDNYEIKYVKGYLTVTKIPVEISTGTSRRGTLVVIFSKPVEGITAANFTVSDGDNEIEVTSVDASEDKMTYILNGSFAAGIEYTITANLSGALADKTHELKNITVTATPVRSGSSGGSGGKSTAKYTVTFEANGGSAVASQTVSGNAEVKEPQAPAKEGFEFAGWYSDKELKTKYVFSAKVTKSITLYAAWNKQSSAEEQFVLTIGEKEANVFGEIKTNDVAPVIVNDRTMLPARFVAENLGAEVEWDEEKRLVTVTGKSLKTGEEVTILITIGKETAIVNGKELKLDSPAFIENDRTYTPVRFIAEELGASVEWLEASRKVIITK